MRLALLALIFALPLVARADDTAKDASAADLFKQLDKNADGQIKPDEVADDKRTLFDRLVKAADKDNSGSLSQDELAEGVKDHRADLPMEKTDGDRKGGRGEGRGQGPNPEKMMKKFDKNSDGKISMDEVPEKGKQFWERVITRSDKDGDKAVTQKELEDGFKEWRESRRGSGPNMERWFGRLDKNKDGKVTLDEVPEERRERFEKLISNADTDKDKALSQTEFTDGMKKAAEKFMEQGGWGGRGGRGGRGGEGRRKRDEDQGDKKDKERAESGDKPRHFESAQRTRDKDDDDDRKGDKKDDDDKKHGHHKGHGRGKGHGHGHGKGHGHHGHHAPSPEKMLERLDKNKDGKLSKEEFVAQAEKRFARIDKNADGSVDASELKQGGGRKHHGGKHHKHGDKKRGDKKHKDGDKEKVEVKKEGDA